MKTRRCRIRALGIMAMVGAILGPIGARAEAPNLVEIKREVRALAHELEESRAHDREHIERLERRIDQLEGENGHLQSSLADTDKKTAASAAQTAQVVKQLQTRAEAGPSTAEFSQSFQRYLGSHTFQVAGAAAFDFSFDQQNGSIDGVHHASQNTFFLDWEPLVLYRPADWILFEAELDGAFGASGTAVDLPLADFHLFLNDYAEVVAGLFDQPFGDWYEAQSPIWVDRFISAPLPFAVEPVVPPSEVGLQLRGGLQWGALGQDFDYTTWIGNGPGFSENVAGASVGGPTPIASKQTNGKAFGGRLRFYPIPVDSQLGRLELGVSTYDGKWLGGNWFNAWGVDFNYFAGDLQTRGEFLESYRQMPNGMPQDNRQGWYVQAGYFLRNLKLPFLPEELNRHLQRLEPLIRYSAVNQHAVAHDDITAGTGIGLGGIQPGLVPDIGLSGSPALFAPHAREVAIGLDYWIAPSIVWKNEFDLELPHAGGFFVDGNGVARPAGSIPNDRAFLSRFTIGF